MQDDMAKMWWTSMHNNVKLIYRDSGDGKVSTSVDTRQVSKLQEGSNDVTCTEFKCKDNLSCHMKIWQGSSTRSKLKRKEQDQRYMWYMWSDDPTFILVFAKNTKWTKPLWSLGFSAPETYITCAIWGKDAQTETSWIWIILKCFGEVWKEGLKMTQVEGNNFHLTCDNNGKESWAWTRFKEKDTKEVHVVLVRKNTPLYYLYLPKIQTNSTLMQSTFFWFQVIWNHFSYELMTQNYAMGAFVQNATHKNVQAPIQKMVTTIELLVKNYTRYIYHICHLVEGFLNSGQRLNPFELLWK